MRRAVVTLVVVAALATGGLVALAQLRAVHVPFVSDTCRVYADSNIVRLAPDQITHAATITAVAARRKLPERAVTIALATAFQESKLRNLAAGDRDSIGLFQQRPSQGWGQPEQLRDPRYAARKFYDKLLKVRGWQQMPLTDAAQAVQRSATPLAYAQWEDEASALSKAFLGAETGAVTCQLRQETKLTGTEGVRDVVAELRHDLGALRVTPKPDAQKPGMTVTVNDGTLGWRTAHWLVAKSHQYGIRRVSFAGKEWTSESGKWQVAGSADARTIQVAMLQKA